MPRVLTCLDEQPAQDGSCAVQAWVEQPSFVPPMTVDGAQQIAAAAALLFATAWVFRRIGRFILSS